MRIVDRNAISQSEFAVLSCLNSGIIAQESRLTIEITEISCTTGIKDNDEILRALYTLEGKNLVTPEPPGDFTSNHWQITEGGKQALRILDNQA